MALPRSAVKLAPDAAESNPCDPDEAMKRSESPLAEYLYDVLRSHDGLVPLDSLCSRVREERGGYEATQTRVRACLEERPGRFLVVDPAPVLPGIDRWPQAVREHYARALGAAQSGPLVAVLTPPAGRHGVRERAVAPSSRGGIRALERPLVDTLVQLKGAATERELARAARAAWALLNSGADER